MVSEAQVACFSCRGKSYAMFMCQRRETNLHTLFLAAFTHEFHDQFDTFSSFPLSSDDLGEVLLQQNMLSLRKIKPHCNDETKHAN